MFSVINQKIMGNEQSHLPGIEIEEKAVEVSDFWSQHSAYIYNLEKVRNLTVFTGELVINGSLWCSQTPLEKNSKNLMIYRHPSIIKYISSWQKHSKYYLAVEEVTPLSCVITNLNNLQISIGLYSILKALCFLHDNANVSHNNVCLSSIYVTNDGSWKLGGMEYLCRYVDMNCDYLNKTRVNRYSKAVDPNEDKLLGNKLGRKDYIDIYAFGALAYDILKSRSDDDIPTVASFCDFCKKDIQHADVSKRPTFTTILEHDFFNQDFIKIHSYLLELPLKNNKEKMQFFQGLADRLKCFNEVLIASQLSGLLLSRLVLLDKTAQSNLLPLVLNVQSGADSDAIFSQETFTKFVCPKLLEIFRVRDVQIRLVLLDHFPNFVHMFTKEELQLHILPELLVGIKDTNDTLVSTTLRTLAYLVPVLGATTVIGGKRAKLFNDGRPTQSLRRLSKASKPPEVIPTVKVSENDQISLSSVVSDVNNGDVLPERPRPDGEEETSTDDVEQSVEDDLDNWDDWDMADTVPGVSTGTIQFADVKDPISFDENTMTNGKHNNTNEIRLSKKSSKSIPDIYELDIKNQSMSNRNDEVDFFQDMEPVINTTNKYVINEVQENLEVGNKLSLKADENVNDDGWGDEEWE